MFADSTPAPTMSIRLPRRVAAEFLSSGVGPTARETWPLSGVLATAACGFLLWRWGADVRVQSTNRLRAAGMLMFFAGQLALAVSIGLGRACVGPTAGFILRYMTLARAAAALDVLPMRNGRPGRRPKTRSADFVHSHGRVVHRERAKGIGPRPEHVEPYDEIRAGHARRASAAGLSVRYYEQWGNGGPDSFATGLAWLQKARLGPYRFPSTSTLANVRVVPMDQPVAGLPVETVRLARGQSFRQQFSPASDGVLRRMDVWIEIGGDGRAIDA